MTAREQLLGHVQTAEFLPPSFHLIPRLLLLLDDDEADTESLASVIRVDPGLTADVLRISNSAAFGSGGRTGTLNDAVMRLGARELYRVIMKAIASTMFIDAKAGGAPGTIDLWDHSLAAACAAQVIASERDGNPETAYTASLLHDIGKVLIQEVLGNGYTRFWRDSLERHLPLWRAEQSEFGIDHAELGSALLQRWDFPDEIFAAVASHHEVSAQDPQARAGACAYLSNIVAHRIFGRRVYREYVNFPDALPFRVLGMNPEQLQQYESTAAALFKKEQESFR